MTRLSAGWPINWMNATTDSANETSIAATAMPPETDFEIRRPKFAFSRNPMNGMSGMKTSISDGSLPFQSCKRVGVQRFTMTKERDDERETHRSFRSSHGHHEKHDDLTVGAAKRPPECHEAQIDRVQHDLDRQQD